MDEMSVRFGIKTRFEDNWAQKKGAPARVLEPNTDIRA
jgi:hypothetical protein